MVDRYIPDRGDLVWLNFDPSAGREQQGRRPAIVLSRIIYNRVSDLAIMVPITSKRKGYPFEVPLPQTSPFKVLSSATKLNPSTGRIETLPSLGKFLTKP